MDGMEFDTNHENSTKEEYQKEKRTRPKRDVVADRERFIEERMDNLLEKRKGERR